MAKRKGFKAKILFADSNSIFSMKEKEVLDGKIIFDKDSHYDVDKVPHQMIQYPDKMIQMVFLIMGVGLAFALMQFVDYTWAIVGFLVPMMVQKMFFSRMIPYPFYLLRWNSATPYDFASAKPTRQYSVNKTIQVKDDIKKGEWDDKRIEKKEIGKMDIVEVKLEERAKGMSVYKPQTLKLMSKDASLDSLLRFNLAVQKDWLMLIIFMALGVMLGMYLQPQLAAMMAEQAAATPPPV